MKKILETSRLLVREFNTDDTDFIIALLNSPGWLQFIGDRGVHDTESAKNYLLNGPMKSYDTNGFGLWHISRKEDGVPVGMCGLLKRDTLDHPDIGFALLPEFAKMGYGEEMARSVLQLGRSVFGMERVVAITDIGNSKSVALLLKIGLHFEKTVQMPWQENRLLFFGTNSPGENEEVAAIDALVADFFSLFNNKNGTTALLDRVYDLCLPQALILKSNGQSLETYYLDAFIAPRKALLMDVASLRDFSESELCGTTQVFGQLAQRFSLYEKSGFRNEEPFETIGVKTWQFAKTAAGWRISSLAWEDAV